MMPIATNTETAIVTQAELVDLSQAEKKHADAKKKAADAERAVKLCRLQLAEKVLGIKTEDELKALTPEKLAKLQARRLEAGDWKPERKAPEFNFVKTNAGRYPAWARLYAQELGELSAARIISNTEPTYSYSVDVVIPA